MAGTAQAHAPADTSKVLAPMQTTILVAYGMALWFGAALILRSVGPLGVFKGPGVSLMYALIVPGTVPFVLLMRRLARLRGDQTVLGITIVTATAALLDGIALSAMPGLYGGNVAGAGATILWGAGVGLALGVMMNGPPRARSADVWINRRAPAPDARHHRGRYS